MTKINHILEAQQFNRDFLEKKLFPLVKEMEKVAKKGGSNLLSGKRMITLFYEPSTRTRASFEIAMDMLGGKVVFSTENARRFSSAAKGETLEDTIRVLNGYHPDVIILRYDEEGGAKRAAAVSKVPIINAGDGTGQHPTQALLDLWTIQKEIGRVSGTSIAMVGDLARGRTVRSLSYLYGKFPEVKIYFISSIATRMKDDIKDYLKRHQVWFEEGNDLKKVAPKVDVIYQTRTQKERGTLLEDKTENFCLVNQEVLNLMKKDAIILHPLPRNEEITPEVDEDPRAAYLRQAENGLYVRMALLKMILAES
ncbi:aspartate carbamoyltransferase [bacterium (Candidatus Gribaldobacteria) CG08_land_8_20_14_0_20_39_15]|uniref:Aspartate carbamoyltransferase n=1 Tax=bacterium (Candidatus Gribaldobacteria) CG08_land_8_20_14_0_20_39_15 TaxID=2014273 RepID=A0A2M6XTZ5_9BACT|nr:MAG: aspartate carbamoyltransferase [bacterium (Candidatus Gribaldobacteria) CG08_land_8_20_14_0_20_39_15]